MKKVAFLLSLLLSLQLTAQEKFSTYECSYIGKPYDIELLTKKDGSYKLYINALSMDALHESGGLLVTDMRYQYFIDALNASKEKFDEWKRTAIENDVHSLTKDMDIKCRVSGFFKYGRDWHYDQVVNLVFAFSVTEIKDELKYLLIISSGKMQSTSNQFMDVDGVILVFTSSEEIQRFIDLISPSAIQQFIEKPKVEELFK